VRPPFERVLCAVDGSPEADVAVEQAIVLAGHDARLTFLTVSDSSGAPPAAEALAPALRAAAQAGVTTESLLLRATHVHEAILAAATDHDLLVLGSHGRHRLAGLLLGSAAAAALHGSPVPVLVARPAPPPGTFPKTLLLATDGSPHMHAAVAVTAALAARHGAQIVLLHVGDSSRSVRHELAEAATTLMEATGSEPVTLQLDGHAPAQVVETARDLSSSLVITGSGLPTGIRALGSVSARIAMIAPCSVLVVRRRAG
jgi:nucleotide-binding universal stress UspA family protein